MPRRRRGGAARTLPSGRRRARVDGVGAEPPRAARRRRGDGAGAGPTSTAGARAVRFDGAAVRWFPAPGRAGAARRLLLFAATVSSETVAGSSVATFRRTARGRRERGAGA